MKDVEFIDAESYSYQKEGMSFKELVLRHLAKISQICTREFKEGYWQNKPVNAGVGTYMVAHYVEDTRDAYINSVNFLNDLLLPYFDTEMKKQTELIEKETEEKLKEFQDSGKKSTEWIYEKLDIKRKLFQQLSLLLKRIGYLEGKAIVQ